MRVIVVAGNDNLMISENSDMEYSKLISVEDVTPQAIDYMFNIVKDEVKNKLFGEVRERYIMEGVPEGMEMYFKRSEEAKRICKENNL